VGPLPPAALVLRFAPSGELLAAERHPLPEVRDEDELERAITDCLHRLRVSPGVIRVRRFSSGDPESLLGEVEQHDHCCVEIVDLPYDGVDERDAARWLSSGAYVLERGDSYYVGSDGRGFST